MFKAEMDEEEEQQKEIEMLKKLGQSQQTPDVIKGEMEQTFYMNETKTRNFKTLNAGNSRDDQQPGQRTIMLDASDLDKSFYTMDNNHMNTTYHLPEVANKTKNLLNP